MLPFRLLLILFLISASFTLAGTVPEQVEQIKTLFEQERYAEAEQEARNFKRLNPSNPYTGYFDAIFDLRLNRIEQAIGHLSKIADAPGAPVEFLDLLGDAYAIKAQTGSLLSAPFAVKKMKKAWETCLEKEPGREATLEKLIMFHLFAPGIMGGNEEEAGRLIVRLQKSEPLQAMLVRGRQAQKNKDNPGAEKFFRQAQTEFPESAQPDLALASLFNRTDRQKEAGDLYRSALAKDPERSNTKRAMADWYFKNKDFQPALKICTEILTRDGLNQAARYLRAEVYIALNRKDEAKSDIQFLLKNFEENYFQKKAADLLDEIEK